MDLPSVAICAIFKNEAPYLREWMLFHQIQGVERFYLYDNGSEDDWRSAIPELEADVISMPGKERQIPAYEDCLANRIEPWVDWIAFIDIDEFLWDAEERTLNEVLTGVKAQAVEVPWHLFGDGGILTKPRGLVVDSYLRRRAEPGPLCKQILRRGAAKLANNPHSFAFPRRARIERIAGLHINHYWTKSEEEAKLKMNRGRACAPVRRQWSEFTTQREEMYEIADGYCSNLFGPILREELA